MNKTKRIFSIFAAASLCTGMTTLVAAYTENRALEEPVNLPGIYTEKKSKSYFLSETIDLQYDNPFLKKDTIDWKDFRVSSIKGVLVYSPTEYDEYVKQIEKKPTPHITKESPLYVMADHMKYSNVSGDISASGDVDVKHVTDSFATDYVYGNTISKKIIIPGEVVYTTPTNHVKADSATYDGVTTIGHFEKMRGWEQGLYYFAGDSGDYNRNENKMVINHAYLTTKHALAKVPDYRIEAERIEIYPNDHYTAYDIGLYLKNTRVISLSKYTGSLIQSDSIGLWTLIPTPVYDSDNGVGFKNSINIPIGSIKSGLSFNSKFAYYSKSGFKPDIGFRWETHPGTFRLHYVKEESVVNDRHVWIKKSPSFSFDSRKFYIPKTKLYVGAGGEVGRWEEGHITGAHKMWEVYLAHDPIELGPHLHLNWRIGYIKDYYAYNHAIRSNAYYSIDLTGGIKWFTGWIGYTNNRLQGETPYTFDTYDIRKPLTFGAKVQITPRDAFSVAYTYGTSNHKLEHLDYTYYRDLHSFYGWIQYRQKERAVRLYIQPKDFTF